MKKFLKISEKRIKKFWKKKRNFSFHYSQNKMTRYKRKICSHFKIIQEQLDFIYMDGPDQFNIKGKVNNITIADYEMMPTIQTY